MALPTAQEVAAKWAQRAGAASQDYLQGAQRTEKDPTALAIAAGPRYLMEVQNAYNSGKWANRLRTVGRQGWLDGITTKGVTNYQTGVSQSQDKVAAAFGPLLAFEAALQSRIASMPSNTDAERDQRMLFWTQQMRTYQAP